MSKFNIIEAAVRTTLMEIVKETAKMNNYKMNQSMRENVVNKAMTIIGQQLAVDFSFTTLTPLEEEINFDKQSKAIASNLNIVKYKNEPDDEV